MSRRTRIPRPLVQKTRGRQGPSPLPRVAPVVPVPFASGDDLKRGYAFLQVAARYESAPTSYTRKPSTGRIKQIKSVSYDDKEVKLLKSCISNPPSVDLASLGSILRIETGRFIRAAKLYTDPFANSLRRGPWPQNHFGSVWCTYPTYSEYAGQVLSRKPRYDHIRHTDYISTSLSELRCNSALARNIVHTSFYGVRSSVVIPEEFRKYFRTRWGFSILTVSGFPSIGLARFCLSLWKCSPYLCFTETGLPLKKFLRRVPPGWIIQPDGGSPQEPELFW
jgi:hypothetical protein